VEKAATKQKRPWHIILLMILAAEAIFMLPFVLPRVFRPTVMDLFQLDNTQLGTCFSAYGVVALVSYLFGGALADRIKPRILMSIALFLTALGGFYLSTYPSQSMMTALYGYWGFTTILMFWAAMIKATRMWGGAEKQGRAFGFLEGGRGLVSVAVALSGVFLFAALIPEDLQQATLLERQDAFKLLILVGSTLVAAVGLMVLLFMHSKTEESKPDAEGSVAVWSLVGTTLKLPAVWPLMIIVCCAYFGYKVTDIFTLYAKEVMGYSEVTAAKLGTFVLFSRPIISIVIGLFADRILHSKIMLIGFALMGISAIYFTSGLIDATTQVAFILSILLGAMAVYGVRAIYFAAMQQGKIPLHLTGTAVGLISIAGYTPDIFSGPLIGYFLDNSPGELGHQHVFGLLAIFAVIGVGATVVFHRKMRSSV
jgi:sugar phosphate permease